MEYHRRGPHQGFWRLKPSWAVPTEVEMLKMVGPEQVVLTESMQVGQRHLQDAGYSQAADVAEGDESNLSVEQQLAPWITTKNFLFATQAKAMLRLHGEGDPSGRGEAFSFIRISMKDIFVKAGEDYEQKMGQCYSTFFSRKYSLVFLTAEAENRPKSAHRYNVAEQQVIYKSEIERIWKAQFDSLSRRDEPQLTDDEDKKDTKKSQKQTSTRSDSQPYSYSIAGPLIAGPLIAGPLIAGPLIAGPSTRPTPPPPVSRGSSMDREREGSIGPDGSKNVLRIRRLVSPLHYDRKQGN
jgi:transcription initiation factor TFIID subunit 1, fungi type